MVVIAAMGFVGMTACKTSKPVQQTQSSQQTLLLPGGPAWGALYMQHAGEYKALCFQAYQLAALRLDAILQQPSSKPRAIVTDIDETILDNSPYNAHQALLGQEYTDASWNEWTSKAAADTIPGALSFLQYAASKGVKVFYITNRKTDEQAGTLQNLQRFNFPNATAEYLLLKTTSSAKESRRESVAKTHDIVLLMGDNLGDFAGVFENHKSTEERNAAVLKLRGEFGSRFIVLPNAMYGDWQSALIKYNYKATMQQRDSTLQKALKSY